MKEILKESNPLKGFGKLKESKLRKDFGKKSLKTASRRRILAEIQLPLHFHRAEISIVQRHMHRTTMNNV